jgi:ketosteroid isomerase-like protein
VSGTTSDDWLRDLFEAIDARDSNLFVGFLTPDARFRFGSAPSVEGADAIAEAVDGFFSSIAGCKHRLIDSWQGKDSVVVEGEVTYSRIDGSEVTVPFANVFAMDGPKIADYKIYIDNGPLFAD